MKILSLDKRAVTGWSIVLGLFMDYTVSKVTTVEYLPNCSELCPYSYIFGFPWKIDQLADGGTTIFDLKLAVNFLFWFVVAFIILSLVRHFRKKNAKITSKQN